MTIGIAEKYSNSDRTTLHTFLENVHILLFPRRRIRMSRVFLSVLSLYSFCCLFRSSAIVRRSLPYNGTGSIASTPSTSQSDASHDIAVPSLSTNGVVYALARQDRAGSAIAHMLATHAYAFHHNFTYGGACFRWKQRKPHIRKAFVNHMPDHVRLLQGLGLSNILRFNCPKDERGAVFITTKDLEGKKYELWTDTWVKDIRSQVSSHYKKNSDVVDMAVHVRRQDIEPCGIWADRYLPNSYFLQQIKENYPHDDSRKVKVTIYSTRENPYEPFDDFSNYTLDLDGDIVETWRSIMTADIVITSKSSFSLVPALLNANGKIIAPASDSFFLTHWRKANDKYPPIDCSSSKIR
jgi:hypothetical protein